MQTEHDIVLPILSVCLSVQCRNCVKMNGHIVTLFDVLASAVFQALLPLQNSKGNPVSGGVEYKGWTFFCKYHHLSLKRYEMVLSLLWNTARKSQVADRSVSVSVTLSDLERPDVIE